VPTPLNTETCPMPPGHTMSLPPCCCMMHGATPHMIPMLLCSACFSRLALAVGVLSC
jgi:hypothetical protein